MLNHLSKIRAVKNKYLPALTVLGALMLIIYVHISVYIDFYRLKLGASADHASRLLGEPDKQEAQMLFCDGYFSWTGECPTVEAKEYWFFKRGIDRWLVLGFDSDGQVIFRSIGKI